METKTYLIKSEYDFKNQKLKQVNNCELTIQFKIMDSCSMLEIIGRYNGRTSEEFKHQILCHKDQNIKILENKNDQVQFEDKSINANVDRVHFDQSFEPTSTFGLHGQLDLEELINEKKVDKPYKIYAFHPLSL